MAVSESLWDVWLNLAHPDPRLALLWRELEGTKPTRPVVTQLHSALGEQDDQVRVECALRVEAETGVEAVRIARRFVAGALERYGVASFEQTPNSEMLVRVARPDDDEDVPLQDRVPRREDFESRLAAAPWDRAIPFDDGRRLQIVALMGACPLVRVEVEQTQAALTITLFERRPPRLSPDGIPYGIFAIGKSVSVDLALASPVGGRRLIDGATGREPRRRAGGRLDAPEIERPGPRVQVPIGRDFDWKALTGQAWFDPGYSDHERDFPPAKARFLSPP